MKTVDLGLPENLEKLNYLMGKITFIEVSFMPNGKVKNSGFGDWEIYEPTRNAEQCFKATPRCDVSYNFGTYDTRIENNSGGILWMCHASELIARCLALVHSIYGSEVPDSVFGEKE